MLEGPFFAGDYQFGFFFYYWKLPFFFHISFQTTEVASQTIYEVFHVDGKIVYRHISGYPQS